MTDEPGNETNEPQEPTGDTEPEIYELEPVQEAAGRTGDTAGGPPDTTGGTGVSPVGSDAPPGTSSESHEQADTPAAPRNRLGESTNAETAMAKTPDAPFTQGLGGIRLAMTTGAVLLLLALIMTGVRAGDTQLSALMLTLAGSFLTIVVNGVLGTLAVIAAARCVGTRVAEPELFALRMLAASAAFMLLYETGTPIPTRIDDFILGLAAYATIVWLLFRLAPKETGLVIAWHAGLVAILWLNSWVGTRIPAPTEANNPPPGLEQPAKSMTPPKD